MHNLESVLVKEMHKILCDFEIQSDHLISARQPNLVIVKKKKRKKKKRTCQIVDFAVPADHMIKLKEGEKKYIYLDLSRELKKLWDSKVTVISVVIDVLGIATKRLIMGLGTG